MNVDNLRFKTDQTRAANKTLYWFNTDSIELYLTNVRQKRNLLQSSGWLGKSIEYKFNSHGFRCEEFSESKNIMFLGCSITLGVGLPVNELYSTKVSHALNLTCYNLGIASSGYDTAFRMAFSYINRLKPTIVVSHMCFPGRIECLQDDQCTFLVPRMNPENYPQFYKDWLMSEENIYINQQKNTLAIQSLCHAAGIKFIDTTVIGQPIGNHTSLARDLLHPGHTYNDTLTKLILSNI